MTITAGHCSNGAWYEGLSSNKLTNTYIGGTTFNSFTGPTGHGNCDCQLIGPIPSGTGTEKVWANSADLTTMKSMATNYGIGREVCISGSVTGTHCGKITAEGDIPYNGPDATAGFLLTDGIETDITATISGDSGGTFFDNVTKSELVGILGGSLISLPYPTAPVSEGMPVGNYFSKASHINSSEAVTVGF